MRKKLFILFITCILLCGANFAHAVEYCYIGNMNSLIFHLYTCQHAKRIAPKNIVFLENKVKALELGFRACKVCCP